MILLVLLLITGISLERAWLASIGFYALGGSFVVMFLLKWGTNVLVTLGYWFPALALTAARLDAWLERDLDWRK
ncbi:hypothetical protein [Falsiruegeria litorea]|nr:hypothetical protein [Falsiruegeria litorea]